MFVMAVNVSAGIDVGDLVTQSLHHIEMQHKEASILCGYPPTDQAQFSRALRGLAPLDFWRLRFLPNKFWQDFLPRLASALIREHFSNLQVPFRMARRDIEVHNERQQKERAS